MAAESEEDPVQRALDQCTMIQSVIDFTAKHLYGLRTQCATTEEITQNEIRESESKLIKLYSKQLVAKVKLATDTIPLQLSDYPNTQQWLKVVGVNDDVIKGIIKREITLETLLEMTGPEIVSLLNRFQPSDDDSAKLTAALRNLNAWTERQLQGDINIDNDIELHWTSYKSANNSPYGGNSPKLPHSQRPSTSSLPPDTYLNAQSPQSPPTPPESTPTSPVPYPSPGKRYTPPPTPPLVRPKGKFPTTPPPQKRNKLYPDAFHPLTKSKSHESQLANRIVENADISKFIKKKKVPTATLR